jgi:hypothetical protein
MIYIYILIGIILYILLNKIEKLNISGVVDLKNGLTLTNIDDGIYDTYDLGCESITDNGRHISRSINSQNYNRTKNFRLRPNQELSEESDSCGMLASNMPTRGDNCVVKCKTRSNRDTEVFTCSPPIKVSLTIHGRISDCNKRIVPIDIPDDVTLFLYVDFSVCLDVGNFVYDSKGKYIRSPKCLDLNTTNNHDIYPRLYNHSTIPEIYFRTDYTAILMYGIKNLTPETNLNNKEWNDVDSQAPEGPTNMSLYLCSNNSILIDFDILTGSSYLQNLSLLPDITDDDPETLQAEIEVIQTFQAIRSEYLYSLGFTPDDFINITIDSLCELDEIGYEIDLSLFQEGGQFALWGDWFNQIGLKYVKCSAVIRVLKTLFPDEKIVFQLFTCLWDGRNELSEHFFDIPYTPDPDTNKQWQYALYKNEWKSQSNTYDDDNITENVKLPCISRFSLSKSNLCSAS